MNILIVDDEAPARARLRQLIDDSGEHVVVGEAADGREALELAATLAPEAVLLDIRMPGLNGIETARHLSTLDHPPAVVFTTAYDEYAIEAFDAQAVGYVLKPVRRKRLEKALQQAARLSGGTLNEIAAETGMPGKREHICARMHGKLRLIPVGEIDYFVADKKYVRVHRAGMNDLIDESLKALEQEFAAEFVRIHRSALVAVSRIESLGKTADGQVRVLVRAGNNDVDDDLVISRRHLANVRRRLAEGK